MSSLLSERISTATNVEDLLQILKAFPIDTLKQIVNNAVDSIAANQRELIALGSCSVHKIIGTDVMQNVLSFIPYCGAVQCVDQTFKTLSVKNAEMRVKHVQAKELINDETETDFEKTFESIFHSNNIEKELTFPPKYFLLTKREITSRYIDNKEVCHSFEDMLQKEYNKIIIFVEEGDYTWSDFEDPESLDIAVIGISTNVVIHLLGDAAPDNEYRFQCNNVYLENVTVVASGSKHILLIEKSNLWMKNSVIKDIKIVIEDAHFYAKHCTYTITSTSTDNLAIEWLGSPYNNYNFTVLGCTFNTCGDSAIAMKACEMHKAQSENTGGNIRIIGNLFKGKCLKSSIIALHPNRSRWMTARDITDWNEGVLRIHFSTPTQIEFNVIVGYGCGHINANEIKPKPCTHWPVAI